MSTGDFLKDDRYRIITKLGKGSHTFTIEDTKANNQQKAMKRISIKNMDMQDVINRIVPEINYLFKFNHENIVKYYDHFVTNDNLYFITEYCEGGDLEKYLENENNKLDKKHITEWFYQLVSAIQYLHNNENSCIHGDLKPLNILMKNNQLKVTGYGISGVMTNPNTRVTAFVGTHVYMAPEQIKGEEYGLKCDAWSLGVILYEMCERRLPFQSDKEIINNQIKNLSKEFEDLSQLLNRILQKNPEERYDINKIETELKTINETYQTLSLIENKRPNSKDIFEACKKNLIEDVEYFIKDFNMQNDMETHNWEKNKTPLIIASELGHKEVVKFLTRNGANVNHKDNDGSTAIMCAAHYGHKDIVEFLASNGADIHYKNNHGWTALIWAASSGQKDVIEFLTSNGANIHHKDIDGSTALMWAARFGQKHVVELLASNGADIYLKNNTGSTNLMWAAFNGHKDVVEFLAGIGTDIHHRDDDGSTYLMWAALNGHTDVVEFFTRNGANINHAKNDGRTALMLAASNGHKNVVEFLASNGANIDNKNKDGSTALMLAATSGHKNVAEFLTSNGANINNKNKDGWTALMLAILSEISPSIACNTNCKMSLFDNIGFAAILSGIFKYSAHYEYKDLVEFFASNGANINHKNKSGLTSLMCAASNGNKDVVEFLVSNGADIHHKDEKGSTALMLAARYGSKDVVEFLVRYGADVNNKNKSGTTALIWAAFNRHKDVVEFLASNGADINYKNKSGSTALSWAARQGYTDIVEILENTN